MALIKCPECGKEVSDKSKVCIHCGYPIEENNNKEYQKDVITIEQAGRSAELDNTNGRKKIKILLPVAFIVMIIFIIVFYINNMSHKDYYAGGALKYEGKLEKGYPNGYGVSYYENGNVLYDGEWNVGLYNGNGKLYYDNGILKYEGLFKDGKINDTGTLYDVIGDITYIGDIVDDEFSGEGVYYYKDPNTFTYEIRKGNFSNGNLNGNGTITAMGSDGGIYIAECYYEEGNITKRGKKIEEVEYNEETEFIYQKYLELVGVNVDDYIDGFINIESFMDGDLYCTIMYLKPDNKYTVLYKEIYLRINDELASLIYDDNYNYNKLDNKILTAIFNSPGEDYSEKDLGIYKTEENKVTLYSLYNEPTIIEINNGSFKLGDKTFYRLKMFGENELQDNNYAAQEDTNNNYATQENNDNRQTPQEITEPSLYGYWENQNGDIMYFDEDNEFERNFGFIVGGGYKVYNNNTFKIFHEGDEEWTYQLDGDMLITNEYFRGYEEWTRKYVSADFNMYDIENDDFDDSKESMDDIAKIIMNLLGKWNSEKDDGSLEFYTEMQCTFIGLNDSSIVGIMNRPYYYTIVDSDTIAFDSHPLYLDADFKLEGNELILYANDNEYIYKKEITYDYDKIIGMYGQWESSDGSIVTLDPFYGVWFKGIGIDNTFFYQVY